MSAAKPRVESSIKVPAGLDQRLDRFLADQYPHYSRTRWQRLIEAGHVAVDGKTAAARLKVEGGQSVHIVWPQSSPAPKTPSSKITVPILYEDASLLVVNKPAGLVVHPAAGHHDGDTLVEILAPKLFSGDSWPDNIRPGLVHRLDRDTSGVIVMAKTPQIQAELSRQFSAREVKKMYAALVKGSVGPEEGSLEGHLSRHPAQRRRFAVSSSGRWALTQFKVHRRFGAAGTLLNVFPLTGRTHQIRVHLAAFGHPIIGDAVYGDVDPVFQDISRQMLHAARLEIQHPKTKKRMAFEAPLPADFQRAIKLIRSQA